MGRIRSPHLTLLAGLLLAAVMLILDVRATNQRQHHPAPPTYGHAAAARSVTTGSAVTR